MTHPAPLTSEEIQSELTKKLEALSLIAVGWNVIESDGQLITIQAPPEWDEDGARELVVDTGYALHILPRLRSQAERTRQLEEAVRGFTKWFEMSGSSISARWDRVPPVERAKIVAEHRRALSKDHPHAD